MYFLEALIYVLTKHIQEIVVRVCLVEWQIGLFISNRVLFNFTSVASVEFGNNW